MEKVYNVKNIFILAFLLFRSVQKKFGRLQSFSVQSVWGKNSVIFEVIFYEAMINYKNLVCHVYDSPLKRISRFAMSRK